MNTQVKDCSRLSRFSAFLARMGLKTRLTRKRPENKQRIGNGITKNTNRRKCGITGKDRKMDNENVVGTELVDTAELEATITDEATATPVEATTNAAPTETPAEPVYDGPMMVTTRKAKAKDGKLGRGRGVMVCVARTPADAEKIAAHVRISTPSDEVVVTGKYTAPEFVTADEFIAAQDHKAQVKAEADEILKGLTPEQITALKAAGLLK